MLLKISEDFSNSPGGRYIKDGKYSGEEFREKLLIPKYLEAVQKREKLVIDFDGTYGYITSFLEESFGGISRIYGKDEVLKKLEFISNDEPTIIDDVIDYIRDANNKK